MIIAIAKQYRENDINPEFLPKKYPENKEIIGSLALHGINGVRIVVISLSSLFSIILAPIIPGTEQPDPTINGIRLFPLKPIRLNTLSKNKDILDIYPVVSKIDIHINSMISCGTKPKNCTNTCYNSLNN